MSGAINEIFRYLDFLPVQMTKYSVILLRFVTEAMSMLVNEGETVRVPCTVDRLEGFVLLWKQKVQYCTILYCSRTFNWRSYCLALCDECLDRFPLFDETLHHIELAIVASVKYSEIHQAFLIGKHRIRVRLPLCAKSCFGRGVKHKIVKVNFVTLFYNPCSTKKAGSVK